MIITVLLQICVGGQLHNEIHFGSLDGAQCHAENNSTM